MNFILPNDLQKFDFPQIERKGLDTLQVNLGYKCNMTCRHCHVDAGPNRKEMMSRKNIDLILPVIKYHNIKTLDLTGGAPELHEDFRYLVKEAFKADIHVIDRCNLTILYEENQEDLAEFLAQHNVEIIASLPCYSINNVDKQRGKGTFDKSIEALKKLNSLGYGHHNSPLKLNLVFNPQGTNLPPSQLQLEQDYKKELFELFSISFNELYTITNVPIKRFGYQLKSKGQFTSYLNLLINNFNKANLENLMCRTTVSVDWQGYLYDCDFNQQLNMNLGKNTQAHLISLINSPMENSPICVADHCFACTAGQGSSCGGAL
jgi:radical SAM/Cys-rich protein